MRLYKRTYRDRHGKTRRVATWSVRFSVEQRVYEVSLGLRDKRAAMRKALALRTSIESDGPDSLLLQSNPPTARPTKAEPTPATVEQAVADYLSALRARGRTETYVATCASRVRFILDGSSPHSEVTTSALRERFAAMRADVSAHSLPLYLSSLRSFLRWLVREGRIETNPADRLDVPRPHEPSFRRRALTEDEYQRLLDATPEPRRLLWLVAVETGLRMNELRSLRWADLDLERGTLQVRASTAKSRKAATLPLSRAATEALRQAAAEGNPSPEDPVLPAAPRGRNASAILRLDLERAGIPYKTSEGKIDCHSLRVSCATRLARAGCNITSAAALLRHSTVQLTFRHYTRFQVEDLRAELARLDDR